MKVCPSCNVRVQEDEKNCPSCDHEFESQDQKKTMMGMPVVGEDGEIDESSVDDGSDGDSGGSADGGLNIDRARLSKALDKARQEETDDADGPGAGSDDDATRQVSKSELSASLGTGGEEGDVKSTAFGIPSPDLDDGDDEDQDAAEAWGIGEQPSSGEVAKTEVVDPDELDFSDDANRAGVVAAEESSDRAFGDSDVESADGDDQKRDFGTLMGMSLDEQSGDQGNEGASMQIADEGASESGGDGSTQALSPEELARVDKMAFGGGDDNGDTSSDRLQPGRAQQSTPTSDNLKTAVLDDSADPGSFQLRKPDNATEPEGVSTPEPGDSAPSNSGVPQRPKTDPPKRQQRSTSDVGEPAVEADEDFESARDRQSDTPMSGVFRAAGEKKNAPDSGEDDGPDRSSVSDTGVGGTGTYQMSNTSTGKEAGDELESGEENLAVGGVGSGGYTTFPTGGDEPQDGDVDSDTASRDDIDGDDGGAGEQLSDLELGEVDDEQPPSGPEDGFSGADDGRREPTFGDDGDDATWEDVAVEPDPVGEHGGESSPGVDAEATSGASGGRSQQKEELGAGMDLEGDGIGDLDMALDDDDLDMTPDDNDLDMAPNDDQGKAGEERAASSPAATTPESGPSQMATEPAEGASSPMPTEAGEGQSHPGDAGASSPTPTEPTPEPSQAPSQPAEASASGTEGGGMQVEQLISLLQRGFGLLGAVTMAIVAIASVVVEGMPAETAGIGALAAPVVLGAVAVGCTVLPVSSMKRSAGYAVIGLLSLGALGAVLVAGFSPILAIANLAGGTLLLVAAAFPLIGRAVD